MEAEDINDAALSAVQADGGFLVEPEILTSELESRGVDAVSEDRDVELRVPDASEARDVVRG